MTTANVSPNSAHATSKRRRPKTTATTMTVNTILLVVVVVVGVAGGVELCVISSIVEFDESTITVGVVAEKSKRRTFTSQGVKYICI